MYMEIMFFFVIIIYSGHWAETLVDGTTRGCQSVTFSNSLESGFNVQFCNLAAKPIHLFN